ncbi:MAG TPA: hypothetical protein PKI14_11020 [Fervidobacterium sp.]|nr:hypothetical protein [Fervidobacterium sp.]
MAKMSKEELFYYRIKNDREWYIENFLKIRDKKSQLIPFKLNHAQRIVMEKIKQCEKEKKLKRFIVLKARQMGLSTLFEGLIFHDTANNPFRNSLIIAHEEPASVNLFNMSKLYYENLPDVIRPMKKYSNGKVLSFENPTIDEKEKENNPGLRSKITIATAGSGEVGRSATINNLHASEVAFFPDAKQTMLGLLQSVPDELNTLVVLESTANGVGDWFHEMWQKAVKGENDFIPIFLPWFIDPLYTRPFHSDEEKEQFIDEINLVTYDANGNELHTYEYELMNKFNLTYEQLNWRRFTIANKCQGDESLFMQEYPATPEEAFISSGRPKFSINALKKYQTITKPPIRRGYLRTDENGKIIFIDDPNGYISIWKEPEPETFYCIGADVAEGLIKGDYSCACVGDSDFDVVAMWHGHIDPDMFGMELIKLGKYYNYAYIGVENNNHGLTTLSIMKREEYWNLFFTKTYDRISDTITQKLGWSTNAKTKPLMIDKLAEFIREMYIGIYSDLIISEAFTYIIEDNGKTNAQTGCHDDTIMACAIMLQLLLEGKGEFYVPEIPIDQRNNKIKETIDPLFESNFEEEFSE